jgi:hypothetical protein
MHMILADVFKLVDQLSSAVLREVRAYIDEREQQVSKPEMTPEQRFRRLEEGFAGIREGLSEEELAELTDAMNAEYIEPWDESEWQD